MLNFQFPETKKIYCGYYPGVILRNAYTRPTIAFLSDINKSFILQYLERRSRGRSSHIELQGEFSFGRQLIHRLKNTGIDKLSDLGFA